MIDKSRFSVAQGDYRFASKDAVNDQVLTDVANRYDQQVMRKISFAFPDQISQRFAGNAPVLVSTKYDGEGVFIYFEDGKDTFAFSPSSGRVRLGFKAIVELEKHLSTKIKKALFRAELYLPEIKGVREGVGEVISVSFQANPDDLDRLKLAIIDVIMIDGEDLQSKSFAENWEKIENVVGKDYNAPFHAVEGKIVSEDKVEEEYLDRIAKGAEGVVVRHLNRIEILKIKPRRTIDAVVIGYVESDFENGQGVTSLLTALNYPTEKLTFQTLVRIGSGFSDELRLQLLPTLEAKKVATPLLMTDSDGRAVHFVKPEIIVEVSCEDVIEVSASNKVNQTQVFEYDSSTASYTFLGLSPSPRPTFATFLKIREDKSLTNGGARIAQISSIEKPVVKNQTSNPPVVLKREVYTKQEMVRKLVVVKHEGDDIPFPYLIYWTDYSAKRKDQIKVTCEKAATEDRMNQHCESLIQSNVVKGWVKFEE